MIGRRVPKNWFRRQAQVINGILSFQEHMWLIIKQSINMAKKQAKFAKPPILFVVSPDRESEDINYSLEWIKIIIQGTPEQEQEEYDDTNKLYEQCGKIIKKDFNPGEASQGMRAHFKTKLLNLTELSEAYEKGYGAVHDNSISQKLLELGIITHLKLDKDYDSRDMTPKQDIGTNI